MTGFDEILTWEEYLEMVSQKEETDELEILQLEIELLMKELGCNLQS